MKAIMVLICFFVLCLSNLCCGQKLYLAADICEGKNSSNPKFIKELNNQLYIFCANSDDGVLTKNIYTLNDAGELSLFNSYQDCCFQSDFFQYCPKNIIQLNNKTVFTSETNVIEWSREIGNDTILKLRLHGPWMDNTIHNFMVLNNKLYFLYNSDNMWIYDGVNDPHLDSNYNVSVDFYHTNFNFQYFNKKVFFGSSENIDSNNSKATLWSYDGTESPKVIVQFDTVRESFNYPFNFTVFNDKLYFIFDNKIWNLSASNICSIVAEIPGEYDYWFDCIGKFHELNSKLYFIASSYYYDSKLLEFDEKNGIKEVFLLEDDNTTVINANNIITFNNCLFFSATREETGNELWMYDGVDRPQLVSDIIRGTIGSHPANFCEYNNKLYFSANAGYYGYELWAYDPEGTSVIKATTKNNFKIFPNPTTQALNIQIPGLNSSLYSLNICSISGKQILTQTIRSTIQTIDVSSLQKGYYIISVSNNAGNLVGSQSVVVH